MRTHFIKSGCFWRGSLLGQKGGLWGACGKVTQRAGLRAEAGHAHGDVSPELPYRWGQQAAENLTSFRDTRALDGTNEKDRGVREGDGN